MTDTERALKKARQELVRAERKLEQANRALGDLRGGRGAAADRAEKAERMAAAWERHWNATQDDVETISANLEAADRELAECKAALAWLVRLKDCPRDAAYEKEKPQAWAAARDALNGVHK